MSKKYSGCFLPLHAHSQRKVALVRVLEISQSAPPRHKDKLVMAPLRALPDPAAVHARELGPSVFCDKAQALCSEYQPRFTRVLGPTRRLSLALALSLPRAGKYDRSDLGGPVLRSRLLGGGDNLTGSWRITCRRRHPSSTAVSSCRQDLSRPRGPPIAIPPPPTSRRRRTRPAMTGCRRRPCRPPSMPPSTACRSSRQPRPTSLFFTP